ncbi:MAG: tRNA pseudouridine synthase A [Firmicutes bacterium ADurb.Bin182]|nr:MAG: tRNA pseudouridine synthase A [Firmicutes bacterium ADurb.Bin182]
MKRIRMIIEYDGTNYVGWQVQPNGVSVQQLIEEQLRAVTGEPVTVNASGRTDSGVHAKAQVAHFDTESKIPPEKFAFALNAGLPKDIRVRYSGEAPQNFHARFDAKSKQYRYTVHNAAHSSAFLRNTALHIHYRLDMERMKLAAALFLGEHDFSAFKAANTSVQNCVRTVTRSEWSKQGEILHYDVEANGFLYNMVRIIAGTMLEIGMGRREPDSVKKALLTGRRFDAGPTAPAHGLMLMRVKYEDFDTDDFLK